MTGRPFADAQSGEIVTGPSDGAKATLKGADVVDAVFETVAAAPRDRAGEPARAAARRMPQHGLGLLANARPERMPVRRGGVAFWTAGLGAVATAFWVSGGHALMLPAAGEGANGASASLRVASFVSRLETGNGRPVLFVDGEIANDGGTPTFVPPFSIDVMTSNGTVRYYMGDHEAPIAPAGRLKFTGRLAAPEGTIGKVSLSLGAAAEAALMPGKGA